MQMELLSSQLGISLPQQPLIGRREYLTDLLRWLQDNCVVYLKGPPGIGKSALAIAALRQYAAENPFQQRIAWVNCRVGQTFDSCVRSISNAFFRDLSDHESTDKCMDRIVSHCGLHRCLVVFDGFEQWSIDPRFRAFIETLGECSRVIITTTVKRKGVDGRLLEVRPLDIEQATQLFVNCRQARPRLAKAELKLVREICIQVGQLPLAVLLLSRASQSIPLKRLLDKLKKDIHFLSMESDVENYTQPRSLIAAFRIGFEALSEKAANLLCRASVLPEGISSDVVTEMLRHDNWDGLADELVETSMWDLVDGGRYVIASATRRLVLDAVEDQRKEYSSHTFGALAVCLQRIMTQAESSVDITTIPQCLSWAEDEWPNIVAAAQFAEENAEAALAGRLSNSIWRFGLMRGHWRECERIHEIAFRCQQESGDELGAARALGKLGFLYWLWERFDDAERVLKEALKQHTTDDHPEFKSGILNNLAKVRMSRGQHSEARELLMLALPLAQKHSTDRHRIMNNLGLTLFRLGRLEEAEQILQENKSATDTLVDANDRAMTYINLGRVYLAKKDRVHAELVLKEGLQISEATTDWFRQYVAHIELGKYYVEERTWSEAERSFTLAVRLARGLRDPNREAVALMHVAQLFASKGEWQRAVNIVRKRLEILQKTKSLSRINETKELLSSWEAQLKTPLGARQNDDLTLEGIGAKFESELGAEKLHADAAMVPTKIAVAASRNPTMRPEGTVVPEAINLRSSIRYTLEEAVQFLQDSKLAARGYNKYHLSRKVRNALKLDRWDFKDRRAYITGDQMDRYCLGLMHNRAKQGNGTESNATRDAKGKANLVCCRGHGCKKMIAPNDETGLCVDCKEWKRQEEEGESRTLEDDQDGIS